MTVSNRCLLHAMLVRLVFTLIEDCVDDGVCTLKLESEDLKTYTLDPDAHAVPAIARLQALRKLELVLGDASTPKLIQFETPSHENLTCEYEEDSFYDDLTRIATSSLSELASSKCFWDAPYYPYRTDHESLFRALQALRQWGGLSRIGLALRFSSVLSEEEAYPNDVFRSEVAKLSRPENGLSPSPDDFTAEFTTPVLQPLELYMAICLQPSDDDDLVRAAT
ncbi:hypothetical protein EYR38_006204 [Pleurotus pulmonarius]|nr:hypothetical protein EYR38_006204 [Pleurotus pulmonarius]